MMTMIRSDQATLNPRQRWLFIVLAFASIPVVAYLHYRTGGKLEFHSFFLLPIIAVVWYGGPVSGSLAALFSASLWAVQDWMVTGATPAGATIFNEGVRLSVFLIVVYLVSGWKAALLRETLLAQTDPLTGLLNRRAFRERCDVALAQALRYQRPVAALFFDLDGFKKVNDSRGHAVGDEVLRVVADVLRARCRAGDVYARLGGDEFAILLTEAGSMAATTFAKMLQLRLMQAMQTSDWPITFSMGVALYAAPPPDADELVRQADALMYTVKNAGKNNLRVEAC